MKLYVTATASLTTKHDGTVATLRIMLDELVLRANEYAWESLFEVKDSKEKMHNIITANRMLTIEDINAAATTYVGQSTRLAQDNHMMATCILNSLTSKGAQALRDSHLRGSERVQVPFEGTPYVCFLSPERFRTFIP